MRSIIKFYAFPLLMGVLFYSSCRKEYSCENCGETNKPPIAIAGSDQVITLPTDSVSLDGSSSSDPDGSISSYLWTKISGTASFNINRPADSITKVKTLAVGAYLFELKVTDNGGLSAKDTMKVIVNDPLQANRPPVANAGADQSITLPITSVNLDGSASTDPDNNITGYAWTKISGPASFSIANTNAVLTQATNLVQDIYQFELKVIDAGGLFSKDTIRVIVNVTQTDPCSSNRPIINAQLIPVGTLSQARSNITIGAAGDKILFAGGISGAGPQTSSRVDIFNINSNTWSTAELSQARFDMVSVTLGNKIYFAGGSLDGAYTTSRIDIYDASNNTWSISELSIARKNVAACVAGNKIFFAGGYYQIAWGNLGFTNRVDIYDASTDSWSIASLSVPRGGLSASAVDNKIYFAGGSAFVDWDPSSQIDIYDAASNSWSTSTLSEAKGGLAGIAVDSRIYWAGGESDQYASNLVEIWDVNTQTSSFTCLFQPNRWYSGQYPRAAAQKNDKIVFFIGEGAVQNKFDLYDITNNTWSIGVLSLDIPSNASIISVNNNIYVAGYANDVFSLSNQVWKLNF